jgi:hypothetical protein
MFSLPRKPVPKAYPFQLLNDLKWGLSFLINTSGRSRARGCGQRDSLPSAHRARSRKVPCHLVEAHLCCLSISPLGWTTRKLSPPRRHAVRTFMIARLIRHSLHGAFSRPNMRGAPQAFERDLGRCQRASRGHFRARRHNRRAAKPRQPSARPGRLLLPRRGARGLCL